MVQASIVRLGNGDFELTQTKLAGFAPLAPLALEELLAGYKEAGVAYLDLQAMPLPARTGLINIGPSACLAGHISLVEGQLGGDSQVQRMPCLVCNTCDMAPVVKQPWVASWCARQPCRCMLDV